MAELFSDEWMTQLKDAWNADPEVKDKLAEINFSSVITCGFKGEDNPRGVFVVENGECVRAVDVGRLERKQGSAGGNPDRTGAGQADYPS